MRRWDTTAARAFGAILMTGEESDRWPNRHEPVAIVPAADIDAALAELEWRREHMKWQLLANGNHWSRAGHTWWDSWLKANPEPQPPAALAQQGRKGER